MGNPLNEGHINILVAFLGDEKTQLPDAEGILYRGISHRGLRDLLTLTDMPENWVLCYFDAEEAPGSLVIRHGMQGYVTPREVLEPFTSLLLIREIPWSFSIWFNEIYKLGMLEGPEALRLTWGEEVNSFVLTGNDVTAADDSVSSENLAELLFDYAYSLDFPILISDRHYSLIPLPGGRIIFAGEGFIAGLAVIIAGTFLVLFLIYSARYNALLFFHIRFIFKHIWIFLVFLPLLILTIRVSGQLYYRMFVFFNAPEAYVNFPGPVLTLILAALLFFLPSPILRLIRFPRRAQFYGFSGVLFIIIGILSAVFLDFSYILVFLWAFIFVFIGAMSSKPMVVFLCAVMVPVFALGVFVNILLTGGVEIADLVNSLNWDKVISWMTAFEASLLILPIMLIVIRGIILLKKNHKKGMDIKPNREYRLVLLPALIILVLGVMMLQINLIRDNRIFPERRFHEAEESALHIRLDDSIFQDSRIMRFNISARGSPLRFDVSLESNSEVSLLPLYSSQVPFERTNEGRRIVFHLGEDPPNPLVLEIAASENFEGSLVVNAIYNTWDPQLDPGSEPEIDDYVLVISRKMGLN